MRMKQMHASSRLCAARVRRLLWLGRGADLGSRTSSRLLFQAESPAQLCTTWAGFLRKLGVTGWGLQSGRLCPNWVPGPAMGTVLASWGSASREKVDLAKRSLQDVWETLNTPPLLRQQASSSMPGPLLMPSQG